MTRHDATWHDMWRHGATGQDTPGITWHHVLTANCNRGAISNARTIHAPVNPGSAIPNALRAISNAHRQHALSANRNRRAPRSHKATTACTPSASANHNRRTPTGHRATTARAPSLSANHNRRAPRVTKRPAHTPSARLLPVLPAPLGARGRERARECERCECERCECARF